MAEPVDNVTAAVLGDDGTFPNSELPVIIYRGVGAESAGDFEEMFAGNGWGGLWRNGIYDYHHYHSTAHEALGIARGSVKVHLGGPRGRFFDLNAGDVVVIPAGVSHKNVGSSDDLLVVGSYAGDREADMNYGRAGERPGADERIVNVPLPEGDPVHGAEGPVVAKWVFGE